MGSTDSDRWMTRKEVANYLASLGYNISPKSLSNMASNQNARHGPPFTRFGWSAVRYKQDDVKGWLEARMERVA